MTSLDEIILVRVDPNPMTVILIIRGQFGHRYIGRMPCDNTGRDWSDESVNPGTPRIAGDHQKPGRSKERFFPRAFRGCMALPTP